MLFWKIIVCVACELLEIKKTKTVLLAQTIMVNRFSTVWQIIFAWRNSVERKNINTTARPYCNDSAYLKEQNRFTRRKFCVKKTFTFSGLLVTTTRGKENNSFGSANAKRQANRALRLKTTTLRHQLLTGSRRIMAGEVAVLEFAIYLYICSRLKVETHQLRHHRIAP